MWTDDPVLRDFKFTNVFRELDRTTVWFRENIRDPLKNRAEVLNATIAFRWFNRIETGEVLLRDPNLFEVWDSATARGRLAERSPVVGGAYIIKTPNGMSKLDGVLWCIDQCHAENHRLYDEIHGGTLENAVNVLCGMPFMGPFMAYEVVTDLRHTHMLDEAPDIMTWANPGPGCARGLSRLIGEDKDHFNRGSVKHREIMMDKMQDLLHETLETKYWPASWPRWEMRDVEHTLCEWDKYMRARLGEGRPKQRFTFAGS
jgi:hypothetical protein